jgi:hypothetical protein
MPGSPTTPGHMSARASALMRIAFHTCDSVGPRNTSSAAQWLAYALPYRRFARTLAGACARLGADAVRYSFTVVDFHHLLLAGFTGAPHAQVWTLAQGGISRQRNDVGCFPEAQEMGGARSVVVNPRSRCAQSFVIWLGSSSSTTYSDVGTCGARCIAPSV